MRGQQTGAEIPAQGIAQPFHVLLEDRFVEAHPLADAVDLLLAGVGAEDDARRVAGHQLNDEEYQERNPPDHEEGG